MASAILFGRVSSFSFMPASLLSIVLADSPNTPNLSARLPSYWSMPLTEVATVPRASLTDPGSLRTSSLPLFDCFKRVGSSSCHVELDCIGSTVPGSR
jgi:hypothetical protein